MVDRSRPAGHEEAVLSIDGRQIAYTVHGRRSAALVFIHGWCGNQSFWRYQTEALEAGRMLVTIDLAGSGMSSASSGPTRESTSIDGLGSDVVKVADHLGLEDIVLVGHSMGGPVALEAARILGPRCRLVVGVETFTDPYFYARRPADEVDRRCAEIAMNYEAFIGSMIDRITDADLSPETRLWIFREMTRGGLRPALVSLRALLEWDIERCWPMVECPCEAINSGSLAGGATVRGLTGLRIALIENCGHFPMIERPAEFNRCLLDILTRHGLRPGQVENRETD
ncbi:alpha/beta fold hydrolase [Mesorhizobium sp. A556]